MRILLLIVMAVMISFTSHTDQVQAMSFKDLDDVPWAVDAIEYLNSQDIIRGYDSDTFRPKDKITRAQASLMLVNAKFPDEKAQGSAAFTDVLNDHFYYEAITIAAENGIVNGYPDNVFRPHHDVKRAEASVMIDNTYPIQRGPNALGFSDATPVKWALESILNLSSQGIISGYPDGLFKPNASINRAEFAVILAAAMNPDFIRPGDHGQGAANHTLNEFEKEVHRLTNIEREKQQLKPLMIDLSLSQIARYKSRDMVINRYFSHESPTYGSPFDMMRGFKITYRSAAENIAVGYGTPESVVRGWMNSPGHRANILTEGLTHIGIGYDQRGNYWTQMFIGK